MLPWYVFVDRYTIYYANDNLEPKHSYGLHLENAKTFLSTG